MEAFVVDFRRACALHSAHLTHRLRPRLLHLRVLDPYTILPLLSWAMCPTYLTVLVTLPGVRSTITCKCGVAQAE